MFGWSEVCGNGPVVMGVLNVTPDSFSDGGRYVDVTVAVEHGLALAEAGAAIIDVGGESTRPGVEPVSVDEELRRVLPVIEELARHTTVPVSVDTAKAVVAEAALGAGARIVNDVTAGADQAMFPVVARSGAGMVLMHMRGTPRTMQDDPRYDDVVDEVGAELVARLDAARAAGIRDGALAADPGIGFAKTAAHNLEMLVRLPELVARVGVPVVVGPSRKRFIGSVLSGVGSSSSDPDLAALDDGTLAAAVWAVDHGASVVRVHEVRSVVRALALLETIELCAVGAIG